MNPKQLVKARPVDAPASRSPAEGVIPCSYCQEPADAWIYVLGHEGEDATVEGIAVCSNHAAASDKDGVVAAAPQRLSGTS